MTSTLAKLQHAPRAGQTRNHECHWPSCKRQVPPSMWGCREHWGALPLALRRRIWSAYVIGQEERGDPSAEYLAVAEDVQEWYQSDLNDDHRHCSCCTTCQEACSDDL